MKENNAEIITLSNGSRLCYVKSNSRVGHLAFFFKAGSRWEGANKVGLAHFLEHCIFKGTTKRSALNILSRLDEVGGDLNAYTAKEEICLHATFLNRYTLRALDLMSDLVQNSTFPEKEIEKEKEVIIDEINSYKDSPVDKMMDEFDALFYPNHPLGNNILGSKKTVKAFTRKDLLDFVAAFFTAENLVISYVGNYSKSKLIEKAEEKLKDMPRNANLVLENPPVTVTPFEIRKKESNYQSHAILGADAPNYRDDERSAMHLIINYLGGPAMNSRLNLSIREKYGLAYHVEANYNSYEDTGFWGVLLSSDAKNLNKSIELAKKELQILYDKGMTPLQLKKSKYQFLSQLSIGWEQNSSKALGNGKTLLVFNKLDSLEEIYKKFESVTCEEIFAVCQKYLHPEKLSMLVYENK